uniref:Uncharacterized protein n=1 Tax=Rhizophora mucronata TaxID=61149 RepID=A0A2P2IXU7_RHIMU
MVPAKDLGLDHVAVDIEPRCDHDPNRGWDQIPDPVSAHFFHVNRIKLHPLIHPKDCQARVHRVSQ